MTAQDFEYTDPYTGDLKTINIDVELITPELAEKYLTYNTMNRNLRRLYASKIRGAIVRGEWHVNGDTISFGTDEHGEMVLLNGQHRLTAIADGELAVPVIVVRGLEIDARLTIDVGAKRTLTDVLTFESEKNPALLASSLAALYLLQRKLEDPQISWRVDAATFEQLADLLDANPGIRDFVELGKATAAGSFFPSPAVMVATLYLMSQRAPEQFWRPFADSLRMGTDLKDGYPLLHLRTMTAKSKMSNTRRTKEVWAALLWKSWNFWATDPQAKIGLLRWAKRGAGSEQFPTLVPVELVRSED